MDVCAYAKECIYISILIKDNVCLSVCLCVCVAVTNGHGVMLPLCTCKFLKILHVQIFARAKKNFWIFFKSFFVQTKLKHVLILHVRGFAREKFFFANFFFEFFFEFLYHPIMFLPSGTYFSTLNRLVRSILAYSVAKSDCAYFIKK